MPLATLTDKTSQIGKMTGSQGVGMGDSCQSQGCHLCTPGSPSRPPRWPFLPSFRTRPTCRTVLLGLTPGLFGAPRPPHQGPHVKPFKQALAWGVPVVTTACVSPFLLPSAAGNSCLRASYMAHSLTVPLRNLKKPLGKLDLFRLRGSGEPNQKGRRE